MTDKEILAAYQTAIRRAEVPVLHRWNSHPVDGRWVLSAQGGWPNDILAAGTAVEQWPPSGESVLLSAYTHLGVSRGWVLRFISEFDTHPHTITAEEGPEWVAQALHVWLEEEFSEVLSCYGV